MSNSDTREIKMFLSKLVKGLTFVGGISFLISLTKVQSIGATLEKLLNSMARKMSILLYNLIIRLFLVKIISFKVLQLLSRTTVP